MNSNPPLVSVVVTTFNHANFLADAIGSVTSQTYPNIELIIVDDGSTDQTRELVNRFQGLIYHYQSNAGLAAARNTGISLASGSFICFLDADDWYYPWAIETCMKALETNPHLAFVYGMHDMVDLQGQVLHSSNNEIQSQHFLNLLKGNFIAMHATVLYCKSVLSNLKFDPTLPACEDYDLYLKISKKFPIQGLDRSVAAYRIHGGNMSGDHGLMLNSVLRVLNSWRSEKLSLEEKEALRQGLERYKNYYLSRFLKERIIPVGFFRLNTPEKKLAVEYLFRLIKLRLVPYSE